MVTSREIGNQILGRNLNDQLFEKGIEHRATLFKFLPPILAGFAANMGPEEARKTMNGELDKAISDPKEIKITTASLTATKNIIENNNLTPDSFLQGQALAYTSENAINLRRALTEKGAISTKWGEKQNVTQDEISYLLEKSYKDGQKPGGLTDQEVAEFRRQMDSFAAQPGSQVPRNQAPASAPVSAPASAPASASASAPASAPVSTTPAPAAATKVLPPVLDEDTFVSIGAVVQNLANKTFPGNEQHANKVALEAKFNNPEFYAEFKRKYDADPAIRKTYQDLMDLAARAQNAKNPDGTPKEMSADQRAMLQEPMRKILARPENLHDKAFLEANINPMLNMANNPMMQMAMKAFEWVKGFFGNFLKSLGFTGPENGHQLLGGLGNMLQGGIGRITSMFTGDGVATAGNGLGEVAQRAMTGLSRAFGMGGQTTISVEHAAQYPDGLRKDVFQERHRMVMVNTRDGRITGHGYELEGDAGDTRYAKNIDDNLRAKDITNIPANTTLMSEKEWEDKTAAQRLEELRKQGLAGPQQTGANAPAHANAAPAAGPGGTP